MVSPAFCRPLPKRTPRPRPRRRGTWHGKRRLIPRHTFNASACVSPLDGRLSRVHGVTSDLSVDGAFVTTAAAPPPVGTLLLLSLYSPHGRFRGLARVAHLCPGRGFGCELLDLRQEQYVELCQLIASREAGGATP